MQQYPNRKIELCFSYGSVRFSDGSSSNSKPERNLLLLCRQDCVDVAGEPSGVDVDVDADVGVDADAGVVDSQSGLAGEAA